MSRIELINLDVYRWMSFKFAYFLWLRFRQDYDAIKLAVTQIKLILPGNLIKHRLNKHRSIINTFIDSGVNYKMKIYILMKSQQPKSFFE